MPASYTLSRGTSNYHTSEVLFPTSPSFSECANTLCPYVPGHHFGFNHCPSNCVQFLLLDSYAL